MSGPHVEIVPGDRPNAWLVLIDGREQSLVDLDDPQHLGFDYVRRIADVVDHQAPARVPLRVLHIGGAGLTLPRYVAATRPGSWQVVLEPDATLTARVREELPLPRRSGVRVREQDGRVGLAALRDDAVDLVVVDAFDEGRVPAELMTTEAAAEAARVLAPGGLLVVNVSDQAPFPVVRDLLAAVRQRLPHVLVSAEPATLRARRPGNLLVVAGHESVPRAGLSARARSAAAPYKVLDDVAVASSFGGGRPRTDAGLSPGATSRWRVVTGAGADG
ncbi:spermidine synthase [Nocardioides dokdonensis FR1436]|uniref:Spermidine synthase n=1 Tax=Nocardioides dokdonensis FR1436 TaxID=1300347 RepID=A0A1A9GQ89_9ACTN|nr:fused MFS/spermidine synthase [Nocardioides dokdonensis]ANH39641.1 spermidine synthase [Nocardioides dokdonensis FR1436]